MPEFGINSGDAGNRRGIDFCVHKHQRVRCLHILYNKGRPAAKSGEYIPKIALKTSTYMCVLQHNICLIWPVWILVHHFFSGWVIHVFVFNPFISYIVATACKFLCANEQHIAQTSHNHSCTHMQIAKTGSFCACFEKFGQKLLLRLGKMLLQICIISNLNIMSAKFDAQTPKTSFGTSKSVFASNFCSKPCWICTFFEKFGQDSMWKLGYIVLQNCREIGLTFTASKPRKSTPEQSCTISMFSARSNRSNPGQSENDNFPRFKIKNYS